MSQPLAVISDFNADPAGRYIAASADAPACEVRVAPYGQVVQSLSAPPEGGAQAMAFIWTRPEGVIAEFADVLQGLDVPKERLMAAVDEFADLILRYAQGCRLVLVASWVMSHDGRGLGMLDWTPHGEVQLLARMNLRLAERLHAAKGVYVLDAARWLIAAGPDARPAKHWFTMKSPFSEQVQQLAARDVKAAMRAALGQTRKLVVVDLDNTMWGGIVGDDGWENLRLGGHDYKGEAFVEFQKALKALTARGIQIGIVSKNEEATALEAIDRHPEMVLRRKDFCGWRINWFDKAQNIVDLARDLNLGLSSVVFLDDNPAERGRVREAIPDVLVPEWPENPVNYAAALRAMDCFDQAAITDEDRARTQMYLEDRDRKASAASFSSIDDWMASLGAEVGIEPLNPSNVKRVVQLINKTNQMNLATRRLTEADLSAWLAGQKGRSVFAVHVGDRFGNLGLTGVISWQPNGDALEIADFILSCRAMGRRVEDVMAKYAVDSARQFGFKRVTARAVPTAKNAPCLAFWRQTDFVELEENFFERSASTPSREIPGIMLDVKAAGTDGQTATG